VDILPILFSLRHNKTGALLIGLQLALTLAIVANSVFIIQAYRQEIQQPSGLDEANIFTMSNEWAVGSAAEVVAHTNEDVAALRLLPGVIDAEATGGFPLCGCGGLYYLELKNDKTDKFHPTIVQTYLVDDHALAAYGLKLVAGRWFTPTEVGVGRIVNPDVPVAAVITRQLANELFPAGNALGQWVSVVREKPSRIVGILEFGTSTYFDSYRQGDAAFVSLLYTGNNAVNYVVRTRPGDQARVMQVAQDKLYALSRQRVLKNVQPFAQTRRHAALDKRTTGVLLSVMSAVLLTVTLFGIIGLTQLWVTQRRRYIGMRRALGARRRDIVEYFLIENLLIAGAGCGLGIILGLAGNTWLRTKLYALGPMSPAYICVGALLVLALSQAAVLWPALRAAAVPPAIATRGL
jgi:putative ABC transport system permease protein